MEFKVNILADETKPREQNGGKPLCVDLGTGALEIWSEGFIDLVFQPEAQHEMQLLISSHFKV